MVILFISFYSLPAYALELWSGDGGEHILDLNSSLKGSWLGSRHQSSALVMGGLPAGERDSALTYWRFRLDFTGRHGERINSEIAYEHRIRDVMNGSGQAAGAGVLPSEASAPYRISQLDQPVSVRGTTFSHRHELDRALVAFHLSRGELIVGRQAVGLGRGVLFSSVDIFSPFSPLEVDREWRRGIDAINAEYNLSDTWSLGLVAAFGDTSNDSACIARLRGYRGRFDGELILGRRARDYLYGLSVSATILGAEIHGEVAAIDTPGDEAREGGLFGSDHYVGKIVLGGSYTFDIGSGLYTLLEYHFSGFGTRRIETAAQRLLDPSYLTRYLRGDTQITGQEALALQISYDVDPGRTAGLLLLTSPNDGSGIISPSLTLNYAEDITIVGTVYLPFGNEPAAGVVRSDYGASPRSCFLQVQFYH